MTSRRVVIDMDGVVVDLHRSWFDLLLKQTGTVVSSSQITDYNFLSHLAPDVRDVATAIIHDGFVFARAEPLPGAIAACHTLVREGFDVRFATMALSSSVCAAKVDWVRYHLGWGPDSVILTHSKDWISAHYAVDDCPAFLDGFVNARDVAPEHDRIRVIGFPHPYNRGREDLAARCDLWAEPGVDDPVAAWAAITSYITSDRIEP